MFETFEREISFIGKFIAEKFTLDIPIYLTNEDFNNMSNTDLNFVLVQNHGNSKTIKTVKQFLKSVRRYFPFTNFEHNLFDIRFLLPINHRWDCRYRRFVKL